jgi:hypothetical protein
MKHCAVCKVNENDTAARLYRQNDGTYWCELCCYAAADFCGDDMCPLCGSDGCEDCDGTGEAHYEEPYYPPHNI